MQILRGCFNGTGAAVNLCLGVIPDSFKYMNVEVATNPETVEWAKGMMKENTAWGGIYIKGSDGVRTKLTTSGVRPYYGGDLVTAANQTVTYADATYLQWDRKNYQADYDYGSGTDGTPLNAWTLDTTANRTGHWNVAKVASGARIGVGSTIRIKENSTGQVKESCVVALTSDGEQADEITLAESIGTGTITYIGAMYDLIWVPIGKITPKGVSLLGETIANVENNMIVFEAVVD